jgi:hypothetical protein
MYDQCSCRILNACLRLNPIDKSNVIFKNDNGKVMTLTCWDAEELLEELVGGVDDDG